MDSKFINKDKKPSDLDYFVFDKSFPLHSNAGILLVGNVGSGKSYFTYNYILPVYIKYGGIKTLLIASRTSKFDSTTKAELENPIYNDVLIYFVKIEEVYNCVQMLKSDCLINEYLLKIMDITKEEDLLEIRTELISNIKNAAQSEFTTIQRELEKLLTIINKKLLNMEVDEIKDWATMKYKTGTKLTYNPTFVIIDDYGADQELMKQDSSIYHLEILRRHLNTTVLINVQSLIAVSTNIRRFTNVFIMFSTTSENDAKLLKYRLPIRWTYKQLLEKFYEIADAEDRDKQMLTLFTTPNLTNLVIGVPDCLKHL